MRIISKFYDYYDKAVAYGIDPNLVYVRDTKEISLPPLSYREPQKSPERQKYELFKIAQTLPLANIGDRRAYVVGFCGKVYPIYAFDFGYGINWKYYYSIEAIKSDFNSKPFVNALKEKYEIAPVNRVLKEVESLLADKHEYLRDSSLKEIDKLIGKNIGDEVFRLYDSPIILVRARDRYDSLPVTINPRLNEFNFIKAIDPIMAFQEISMFIGSNLAKQIDPIVNHSDELKIEQHGFDKLSFRKEKSKKR